MKRVAIIISPNYKDYARRYLGDCIRSIRAQDYQGETKIFITDNESSKESFIFLKNKLPEAQIHKNKNNDGFAKGCNDCIKLALKQEFDYIALFNIHSVMEEDYISQLVKAMESDEDIAVAQGLMLLDPKRNRISSLGNDTHFLGFGYCRAYDTPLAEHFPETPCVSCRDKQLRIRDIFYPSGSSMFFRKKALEEVGLFDEEYWMYNEDQELPWRMRLRGWRIVLAPWAVMYNKYEFQRSIKKFYWMDRNRIISILKCYRLATLFLIMPAFVIMELGLILFSLKSGWFKEKIKVWKYFGKIKTWKYLFKARQKAQKGRVVGDREIAKLIVGKIWYQEIGDWKLCLINPFFNFYWSVLKKIIWW